MTAGKTVIFDFIISCNLLTIQSSLQYELTNVFERAMVCRLFLTGLLFIDMDTHALVGEFFVQGFQNIFVDHTYLVD